MNKTTAGLKRQRKRGRAAQGRSLGKIRHARAQERDIQQQQKKKTSEVGFLATGGGRGGSFAGVKKWPLRAAIIAEAHEENSRKSSLSKVVIIAGQNGQKTWMIRKKCQHKQVLSVRIDQGKRSSRRIHKGTQPVTTTQESH